MGSGRGIRKNGGNIRTPFVAFHRRGEFPVVPEFKGRGVPKLATPCDPGNVTTTPLVI
jgi:hypothetical protein